MISMNLQRTSRRLDCSNSHWKPDLGVSERRCKAVMAAKLEIADQETLVKMSRDCGVLACALAIPHASRGSLIRHSRCTHRTDSHHQSALQSTVTATAACVVQSAASLLPNCHHGPHRGRSASALCLVGRPMPPAQAECANRLFSVRATVAQLAVYCSAVPSQMAAESTPSFAPEYTHQVTARS